jgi:hypothetical protein
MRLFQSPVFHAYVETMSTKVDRPIIPRMFLPCSAKEYYLFFKAVLEEAGIDTSTAQKRTLDEAGFDSDSTSEP